MLSSITTNSAEQLLFLVYESSVSKRIIHGAQQFVLVDFRFLSCLCVAVVARQHCAELDAHRHTTEGGRERRNFELDLLLPLLPLLIMLPVLVRRMVARARHAH